MSLYYYSLVRCVPQPRTGEFINVGAIAGSEDDDNWDVRQLSNERRAARLCSGDQLGAVHRFLAEVAEKINGTEADEEAERLTADWLQRMYGEMRNVVQLSEPKAAVADSASAALDLIFDRMLIEPERSPRTYVGKATLLAALRKAFKSRVAIGSVYEKPEVFVGDKVRAPLDFAIGAETKAVQITQAWSFQKDSVDDVSTEVKSWGYALQRLRDGDEARIISKGGLPLRVAQDIEIDVLMAAPETPRQTEVFEEAQEVFSRLQATTFKNGSADDVGERARLLVAA